MPEFGTCECAGCYVKLPKNHAHRVTIEVAKGRSGGSYRFNSKSTSYSTGRTYYTNKDIWLCESCYQSYSRRKDTGNLIAAGIVIALFVGGAMVVLSAATSSRTPVAAVAPVQTASIVREVSPTSAPVTASVPPDVTKTQKRLIELRYLNANAAGVWGLKSRAALREFKMANALGNDDSWNDTTARSLFSTNAIAAPLSLAPTANAVNQRTR